MSDEALIKTGRSLLAKGERGGLVRLVSKVTTLRRDWRGAVLCPNCSAVLMSGTMLPPGTHNPACPVCKLTWNVAVSGGSVTAVTALMASIGDAASDAAAHNAERKWYELKGAIERGEVRDPVSAAIASITLADILISLAVSATVAVGTALLTRALTPRQKFTTGQMQGALTIPQSDHGLSITEGYGADPASKASPFQPSKAYALEDRVVSDDYVYIVTTAGTSGSSTPTFPQTVGASVASDGVTFTNYGRRGGGFKLGMLIPWASKIRKHENTTQGGGGGKGPKPAEQTTIEYDIDLAVMPARGPLNVTKIRANIDTIYRSYSEPTAFYQAENAARTGGASIVTDALASGGQAVSIPQNGTVTFTNVASDGTPVILEFYLKSTIENSVEMNFVGDPFNDTIGNTGGVYALGEQSLPFTFPSSSNSVTVKNLSATAFILDRLGVRASGGSTGVPHPEIPPDDDYDPDSPHTPTEVYDRPSSRFAGELDLDSEGVRTGTLQAGSYANIAIYPGNDTQLPDPTIQSAVDALHGEGSTPAFRGRLLEVLTNFYMTKWGGALPVINTWAEHQEVDTLELFFAEMCDRTGVLTPSDYEFPSVRRLFLRGLPITPPYAPADVMAEVARIFNVYFVETDKIRAYERGSAAPVATLSDASIGWIDGESEDEERETSALEFDIAGETEIARRCELTFIDPERDLDQNSQGYSRQITRSEKTEKIQLAVTMFAEESRAVTQRETYEEEVESTKYPSFGLDWSYLWVNPGDTVVIEEADGTTSTIFIEDIKHNIGVIPVSGYALETAVYSQPVSTSGGVYEIPPVPIPAMTIVSFGDIPAIRTEDDGRPGFIAWVVKRAGDGDWRGAVLYKIVEGEPQQVATFTAQATAGKVVTKLGAITDTSVEDSTKTVTANAGTDTLTSTAHGFENGETVAFSTSGTLPAGLSNSTLYYVINTAANTFKVSTASGGSAVDITSTGSGTHSVQRVIDVDLHDETVVLESVTADQIANGSNACLFGNELLQVRTWERLAGFTARWRGRDFTRGLRGTLPAVSTHAAGERFVLLNDAVKFVPQDIGELNIERDYKAVTDGQSLDDAATVSYAWTGGALKYAPVTDLVGLKDAGAAWQFHWLHEDTSPGVYDLLVLSSDGLTVKRTIRVRQERFNRALLHTSPSVSYQQLSEGKKFTSTGFTTDAVIGAVTVDPEATATVGYFVREVFLEPCEISGTYNTDLNSSSEFNFPDSSLGFTDDDGTVYELTVTPRTSVEVPELVIAVDGADVFTDTDGEASGTRFTIRIKDTRVEFFRNLSDDASAVPFYVSPRKAAFPVKAFASAAPNSSWTSLGHSSPDVAATYGADLQTEDFGSTQSSLRVRVYRVRTIQGVEVSGMPLELTF